MHSNNVLVLTCPRFFTALALMLLITAISCDLTEQRFYEIQELDYAEEQIKQVEVLNYRGDLIERTMTASRLDRYYDDQRTISYEVTIRDFDPEGNLIMTMEADTLIVEERHNTYTGRGNVIITRDEGVLMTEHLIWDQNSDEVFSPVLATLVRERNVLRGYELRTDTEFTRVELKRVTAEGVIDEEDFEF